MGKYHDKVVLYCVNNLDAFVEKPEIYSYEVEKRIVDGEDEYWIDIVIERKTAGRKILIEVKPKLEDVGQAIRQIKTYRRIYESDKEYLITANKPTENLKKLLENENIKIVKVKEDLDNYEALQKNVSKTYGMKKRTKKD